jgi:hypothetical protein
MTKGKVGRKPWEPKDPARAAELVEALVGFGHTLETVAKLVDPPCSVPTLKAYFASTLDAAVEVFRARVEAKLAGLVLGSPEVKIRGRVVHAAVPPDKTLMMFLLKTRFGYRETNRTEMNLEGVNIAGLSDVQLSQLVERISGAIAQRREDGAAEAAPPSIEQVH